MSPYKRISKTKISAVAFFVTFYLISGYLYLNHLYAFRFPDEAENILGGKLIASGQVLYRDFLVQHQPMPYVISGLLQSIFQTSDIRSVIKIHRLFIWVWQIILAYLIFRQNYKFALMFLPIFEIFRYSLFGSLFLAESLATLPFILLWLMVMSGFTHSSHSQSSLLIPILGVMVLFTLQINWPALLLLFIIWFFSHSEKRLILGAGLALVLISLSQLHINSWWQSTIALVASNYIPTIASPLGIILAPLNYVKSLAVASGISSFGIFEVVVFWLFILLSLQAYRRRHQVLVFFNVLLVISLLLRPMTAGAIFYEGFHRLPALTFMIAIVCYRLLDLKPARYLYSLLLVTLIMAKPALFQLINSEKEFHEQFSFLGTQAKQINRYLLPEDTYLVLPENLWLSWSLNGNPATRYIFFYEWMNFVPQLTADLNHQINTNLPKIIYAPYKSLIASGVNPDWLQSHYTSTSTMPDLYVQQ